MKKIYSLFAILLCLIILVLYSDYYIKNTFEKFYMLIEQTETALLAEDYTSAAELGQKCIDVYKANEKQLYIFISSESLGIFNASVFGMSRFATEQTRDEAMAEAARAKSQLTSIENLFFRLF